MLGTDWIWDNTQMQVREDYNVFLTMLGMN